MAKTRNKSLEAQDPLTSLLPNLPKPLQTRPLNPNPVVPVTVKSNLDAAQSGNYSYHNTVSEDSALQEASAIVSSAGTTTATLENSSKGLGYWAERRARKKRRRAECEEAQRLSSLLDKRGTDLDGDVVAGARRKALKLDLESKGYERYFTRHDVPNVIRSNKKQEGIRMSLISVDGGLGKPIHNFLRFEGRPVHNSCMVDVVHLNATHGTQAESWVGDALIRILESPVDYVSASSGPDELKSLPHGQVQAAVPEVGCMDYSELLVLPATPSHTTDLAQSHHIKRGSSLDAQISSGLQRFWWGDLEAEEGMDYPWRCLLLE